MNFHLQKSYINNEEKLAEYLSCVDIDSYAVCVNHLSSLRIGTKFPVNINITVSKCKNTKLTSSLEALTDSGNEAKARWYEYCLGGFSWYRTFVLMRITSNTDVIQDMKKIHKYVFLDAASDLKLDSSTGMYQNCIKLTKCKSSSSNKKCTIYKEDWVNFANSVELRINAIQKSYFFQLYMYRCEHGLKDPLGASIVQWIEKMHLSETRYLVCLQIHVGFTFQGKDTDIAVLVDPDLLKSASLETFPKQKFLKYSKFLLKECSHVSGFYSIIGLEDLVTYLNVYSPIDSVVKPPRFDSENNRLSFLSYRILSGYESKSLQKTVKENEEVLRTYLSMIKENYPLRFEVVISSNKLNTVNDVLDIPKNYVDWSSCYNHDHLEKLKIVRKIRILKVLANVGCLVKFSRADWHKKLQNLEEKAEIIFDSNVGVEKFCSKMNGQGWNYFNDYFQDVFNCSIMGKNELDTLHDSEMILRYSLQGSTLFLDGKRLKALTGDELREEETRLSNRGEYPPVNDFFAISNYICYKNSLNDIMWLYKRNSVEIEGIREKIQILLNKKTPNQHQIEEIVQSQCELYIDILMHRFSSQAKTDNFLEVDESLIEKNHVADVNDVINRLLLRPVNLYVVLVCRSLGIPACSIADGSDTVLIEKNVDIIKVYCEVLKKIVSIQILVFPRKLLEKSDSVNDDVNENSWIEIVNQEVILQKLRKISDNNMKGSISEEECSKIRKILASKNRKTFGIFQAELKNRKYLWVLEKVLQGLE